ncbi:hypothetical protein HRE53_16530 [Acaryochloris sp. 'Moss Beach']|uniref:hypothetical protein n=1 Tax=Acaryochloris sp. 'Moss Beach' TaxID=2740837 RepID=UPI001F48E8D4|nr:hypothetical protein [Acaryochloris sp. 'Moss Beach']UJB68186.1 hypothetical protein HRE53_16530 [Acaryochloris sp. 'Moss Beach']
MEEVTEQLDEVSGGRHPRRRPIVIVRPIIIRPLRKANANATGFALGNGRTSSAYVNNEAVADANAGFSQASGSASASASS